MHGRFFDSARDRQGRKSGQDKDERQYEASWASNARHQSVLRRVAKTNEPSADPIQNALQDQPHEYGHSEGYDRPHQVTTRLPTEIHMRTHDGKPRAKADDRTLRLVWSSPAISPQASVGPANPAGRDE